MSWPEVALVAVCVTGFVAALWVTLPYLRSRSDEQTRSRALEDFTKRLNAVEAHLMERRGPGLPTTLRRGA